MTLPYLPTTHKRLKFLALLAFILLCHSVKLSAQFSAGASGISYELGRSADFSGIDTIAVFENTNVTSNPTISFTYDGVDTYTYTWFKIDNGGNETEVHQEQNSLSTTLNIYDQAIGEGTYRLQISNILVNTSKYCAVIDYENYPIAINDMIIHDNGELNGNTFDPCVFAYLEADFSQNDIEIYDPVGGLSTLTPEKNFAWTWSEAATSPDITGTVNPVQVLAVYKNSTYTCSIHDDFFPADANEMNNVEATKDYDAIAVTLSGINFTVIERPGDNEYIKFEVNATGQLTGSAPLKVDFDADEPSDGVKYYQWQIWHGTDTARAYTTNNTQVRGYEFTTPVPSEEESNAADYTVKLVVSSDVCDSSATQEIKLRTSRLEAPNLFVIGFGAQLDYRADYSSIRPETFHGYIYNRWGRKVYEWDDLTTGWDGRLHGTGAFVSPGAYVVVLRGEGTDGKEYKVRHSLTILREK